MRIGILYPPTGSEHEYYAAAETLRPRPTICLAGVRIHGGAREHELRHLRRTAAIDNLLLSARSLAPLAPASVMWACTSGSFVDGLGFARAQATALSDALATPCSSTSLAFVSALEALGIARVAVLSSYPARTARAFHALLAEAGVEIVAHHALNILSGPMAAQLGPGEITAAAHALPIDDHCALLVPDTAIATVSLVPKLEQALGRVVLGANPVTLWEALRLAGAPLRQRGLGRLFGDRSATR